MYRVRMSDGTEFGPADLDTIVQWAREGRIPRDALLYPPDTSSGLEPRSVFAEPRLAALLSAPPTMPTAHAGGARGPATAGSFLIPTGNQPALWGYYISVVGFLIPLLCPISFVLGIVGVVRAIANPQAKGLIHAIVAILLSLASPAFWWYITTQVPELMGL